jgi:1-acyl-sn-glycerol-3-phosphate acyltransferase
MSRLEWLGIAVAVVALATIAFVVFLPWLIQPLIRILLWPRYGFRVRGRENVPKQGAAVLVVNHVTWIDGLFVAAATRRHGRIFANSGFFENRLLRFLARRAGMVPVPFSGPKAQRAAIVAARETLDRGELLVIFPEGQLTRNGLLGPFYRGMEVILKGRGDVPVVPVALDNLWGSIWSFRGGRAFGKRPIGFRRVINVCYGQPLSGPPSLSEVRLAILRTLVDAVGLRKSPPQRLETLDLALPHLEHPELGLLCASAPDYDRDGIVQPGQKAGTVGLPVPGVALRVVDAAGQPLAEDQVGRVQACVVAAPRWVDTGLSGRLDGDGFLTLV